VHAFDRPLRGNGVISARSNERSNPRLELPAAEVATTKVTTGVESRIAAVVPRIRRVGPWAVLSRHGAVGIALLVPAVVEDRVGDGG
jgi:hypothetical protein